MPVFRLAILCLAGCALLIAQACAPSSSPPPPTSPQQPQLVVLSPALAVIIRDLGRSDTIVARHAFDRVTDQHIPVAGDQSGLDYEAIARAEPTIILIEQTASPRSTRLDRLATALDAQVIALPMLTLDDIEAAIVRLTTLLTSEGDKDIVGLFQGIREPSPTFASHTGRTLILSWSAPPGVMGPGSFHHQLLAEMGATPIPQVGSPYISMTPEDVLRLDPDTLILLQPGASLEPFSALSAQDRHQLLGSLATIGLRAVDAERVIVVESDLALLPSTSLIDVAAELRAAARALPGIARQAQSP